MYKVPINLFKMSSVLVLGNNNPQYLNYYLFVDKNLTRPINLIFYEITFLGKYWSLTLQNKLDENGASF